MLQQRPGKAKTAVRYGEIFSAAQQLQQVFDTRRDGLGSPHCKLLNALSNIDAEIILQNVLQVRPEGRDGKQDYDVIRERQLSELEEHEREKEREEKEREERKEEGREEGEKSNGEKVSEKKRKKER